MPRGLLSSLSLLFSSLPGKEQGKKVVLPALGGPAHSKIPACKCSWQLFKIGKCICVKSSFPGVGRGGMKGGGLDACLVHDQAAPPGSKRLRQGQSQAQHAAGQGSLLQGSGRRVKTFCPALGLCHPQATAASQAPGPGCSAFGQAPGEGHYGSMRMVIVEEHEAASWSRAGGQKQPGVPVPQPHPATAHQRLWSLALVLCLRFAFW